MIHLTRVVYRRITKFNSIQFNSYRPFWEVTNVYNYNIKDISHLMMAQEGRNM
jgi:hypothetical protein